MGEPLPAASLAAALQVRQLFVYFGHGGGDQYLPSRKLRRYAATILMDDSCTTQPCLSVPWRDPSVRSQQPYDCFDTPLVHSVS